MPRRTMFRRHAWDDVKDEVKSLVSERLVSSGVGGVAGELTGSGAVGLLARWTGVKSLGGSSGLVGADFGVQAAGFALMGPAAGAPAVPAFRGVVASDVPALPYDPLGAAAAVTPTTLGLVIGTHVQGFSARLTDIAAVTPTDGTIFVGNGTTWVAESDAIARASLGVPGISGTPANNQLAVWTGATDVEGDPKLTWSPAASAGLFLQGGTASGRLFLTLEGERTISGMTEIANFRVIHADDPSKAITEWAFLTDGVGVTRSTMLQQNVLTAGTSRRLRMDGSVLSGLTYLETCLLLGNVADAQVPGAGTFGLIFGVGTALASMAAATAGFFAQNFGGTVRMCSIDQDNVTGPLAHVVLKATTGDPTGAEGRFCINAFDNTIKMFADGAWRTIHSGW